MRIVIDTNVVASAIFFGGRPKDLIELVVSKKLDAYASTEIITEYQETTDELCNKYPEKSVITGHILNRDHYPQTEEIVITMPFFDRVDCRYSARIDNCGNFKIILYP